MDINELMALKLKQVEEGNKIRPQTQAMFNANEAQDQPNAIPFTPEQMKQMNTSMTNTAPVVEKEHALDVGTTKKVEAKQQNDWLSNIVNAIPGIAKGVTEFAGKPEGMKTFAALTADPYMKEALLNRGNEMQKIKEAQTVKDRDMAMTMAQKLVESGDITGATALAKQQGFTIPEGITGGGKWETYTGVTPEGHPIEKKSTGNGVELRDAITKQPITEATSFGNLGKVRAVFSVNGKQVQGFADHLGNYFDEAGNPQPKVESAYISKTNPLTGEISWIKAPSGGGINGGTTPTQPQVEGGLNVNPKQQTEINDFADKLDTGTYKETKDKIQSADTALSLLDTAMTNPIAAEAVKTSMARLSGEVGVLTDQDVNRFGGSKAIVDRIEQATEQMTTGKLTKANRDYLKQLADVMRYRQVEKNNQLIDRRLSVMSKTMNIPLDTLKNAFSEYYIEQGNLPNINVSAESKKEQIIIDGTDVTNWSKEDIEAYKKAHAVVKGAKK